MKTAAIMLFALTYILMLALPKYRQYVTTASAAVFVVMGVVAPQSVLEAVDWNVILMLAGTMGTVNICIESQMPARIADIMVNRLKSVKLIFVALALFFRICISFYRQCGHSAYGGPHSFGNRKEI